ncbi:MAG TPA: NADH:flavin oxidoreductase/NADH oxidase [Longimicrobiaceae bacterium]|jgi:2,4-dienoyl-CoA reductase-like NADH-dependent reductase (Old Yellow Enzyme family)|nr:NADH:flavin oxidoreductase/NADH oxidase [Longimicrobiaceae bacterium]
MDSQTETGLFTPLTLRGITFRNRIGVSPMCQYWSRDGFASDWHLVHLGSRAVGGAGAVIAEATAVTADGRISPQDLGIWTDAHVEPLARCVRFIHEQGAVAGVQLAHAGRKASTFRPWQGRGYVPEADGGWRPIHAPSAVAFDEGDPVPEALTEDGIRGIVAAFRDGARRSLEAGFRVIELHAAHGYLLHQFLSPLSNRRTDAYGGSFENRTRIVREVVSAVREVWPEELPLFIRISATDWVEGGWDVEQSVELARVLGPLGVDLVDCSSGGLVPRAKIPVGPGYQAGFAERIRHEAGIATAAVGLITDPEQANGLVAGGTADMVLLARQMLRDPYWPLHAARRLGVKIAWPVQYERAAD